ncbi:hypothetical protein HAX54_010000, partial [Datura stramonium]|nr:hypothetical protein [Datura stramonium]
MKLIANNLVVDAKPIKDEDLVLYILGGLGPDYDTLVVFITSRSESITLVDLHGLQLSYELRLEHFSVVGQGLSQVNLTIKNSNVTKSENNYKKQILNYHGGRIDWERGRGGRMTNSSTHFHNANG